MLAQQIDSVRRFNRFHTKLVGALNNRILATEFSLPQARILYELATNEGQSAADLAKKLALNPGHLSRQIASLSTDGLISKKPDKDNGKRMIVSLTNKGRSKFAQLNEASAAEIGNLLKPIAKAERRRLVGSMERIEKLLGDRVDDRSFVLRDPEPGDLGLITSRQAVLYAREYDWDWTFEALVGNIVAGYIDNHDPKSERCWVAEREGEVVGSVFVVKQDAQTAKLRLLYVEPSARGLGIGGRLVDECIRFARVRNYRRLVLWTNDVLVSARKIYQEAGFKLIVEEPHNSFGQDLIGQNWELEL